MRSLLALLWVFVSISAARGQEQEQKLLDRLLKPDTSLQSKEQNKKFAADRSSVDKKAAVGTFYLEKKPRTKNFSGTRELPTNQFDAQKFEPHGGNQARVYEKQTAFSPQKTYTNTPVAEMHPARDAKKQGSTRDYWGNRPFLDQGKSQKSLSRKNKPMTIEQVRELLNKNK